MMLEYLSNPTQGNHKSRIPGGHRQQDLDKLERFNLIDKDGDGTYSITEGGKARLKNWDRSNK